MASQTADCALLTPQEMAEADRLTIAAGTSERTLIERAGRAVAEAIAQRYERKPILVLCGSGNNGADGLVAARELVGRGWPVTAALAGARTALKGEIAELAADWGEDLHKADVALLAGQELVVDALLGAGLSRDVSGELAVLVEAVNASGLPVMAVDMPTGIDGATGQVRGVAVRAKATVTFVRPKPGHRLLPGRVHSGEVLVADIGITDETVAGVAPATFENLPALWRTQLPRRTLQSHKYRHGHAVAVSGPAWSTGAIRLSALAALRAGAGLVTVASPAEALPVHAAHLTAVMLRETASAADLERLLADRRMSAVLIGPGCGIGPETRARAAVCMASGAATVLDADALTTFADAPGDLRAAIGGRADRSVVLTPHEGEFSRLFRYLGKGAESRIERCRAAAVDMEATVILKGPDTVVASPDGRASIAANAPPWLATAGSGDVLAGFVLGLLAQHMPAFEAASAAVWMHGEAASAFGPGLIAEDLPGLLPPVLARLLA
ncbi:MAG: NAD(P)H-hydrate dehydratase [Parvibaculaceae bacterium]